ncbi:hypothetical protein [Tropicimonas sp. S265A]|uniref:hypothetical protein n=1 Tax=Tropicimonas sp. S265A TaxID=3415134 RepID=UPI003C7BAFB9
MPRADNLYSQFVTLAKITLPVLGLGLLSSLFLLSNEGREVGELPYSEVELEDIVENQRVGGPRYQTILENGSSVDLRARTARPLLTSPGEFLAEEVFGILKTSGGTEITLDGGQARIDQNAKIAVIDDGLRIVHGAGYIMTARGGTTTFDGTEAVSEGDVVVVGEQITLNAARAELKPDPATNSQVIVFSGGVRVLYKPQ